MNRQLRVLHRDDLAHAHLAVAPVHEAHGLAHVQVLAHHQDAPWIGQHSLDNGVQLEQLQVARLLQQFQQPGVDAGRAHAAFLVGHCSAAMSMRHGSKSSMRLIGCSATRRSTSRR